MLPVEVPSSWMALIKFEYKLLHLREMKGWGLLGFSVPPCGQTSRQFSLFLLRGLEIKEDFLGDLEALEIKEAFLGDLEALSEPTVSFCLFLLVKSSEGWALETHQSFRSHGEITERNIGASGGPKGL